ncbi:MAG: response regulator receiver modulated metal dependent phosphohydrolase [Gemmatimonadetes bacterium]|nr:response regulator receiver modulated metal dependent phosphohydrolase [Gemmatimonadota bacterium]
MGSVLVVDDNSDLCQAVTAMIRLMGAHAECAPDGHTALSYLAQRPVDLVILDYMMPDMDGITVLRRLRADPKTRDVPVLFFTAVPADELREQAAALGARAVVEKGAISFNTLRPWIAPLIEEPAQRPTQVDRRRAGPGQSYA